MNERECLSRMVSPGMKRPGKWLQGVIQIHVTRACDKHCYNCTQGSNFVGKNTFMPPIEFEKATISLRDYWGVVGVFGGNPAVSPHFEDYCSILRQQIPYEQRGLWCNNPLGKGKIMRDTFNPAVSNLNVHMDRKAYDEFRRDWPECRPFGLDKDSRHSPVYVAMKDVIGLRDEDGVPPNRNGLSTGISKRYELISNCDINQHWSAAIGLFRGELRAWFCEIAMAQSILHQDEPDYPDTGTIPVGRRNIIHDSKTTYTLRAWWELPMISFSQQVDKHCHECGVPLRGYGELAQSKDKDSVEQVSITHLGIARPKHKDRPVEEVHTLDMLETGKLERTTNYIQNSSI
jgi:hypothetical protein